MTTSILFREYILLRARSVLYVALLVALGAALGLVLLVMDRAVNITRTGLVFQLLAVLAILPEVVGKKNLQFLYRKPVSSDNQVVENLSQSSFDFYLTHNQMFILGNIMASLILAWLLVDLAFSPAIQRPEWEFGLRLCSGLLGFAWLDLFMGAMIYRLLPSMAPSALIRLFFIIDFLISFFGMVLAAIAYLFERWLLGVLRFIYQGEENNPRRVLLWISLPFFLIGLGLEILATWM